MEIRDSILEIEQPQKEKSAVRSVNGSLVFLEEHLGKGQYGQVCKAKL